MNILEELWYGNISPMETSHIERNPEYKKALQLVNSNFERLQKTLTPEQGELLERYSRRRNEFGCITELDAFKTGFKLGAGLAMESLVEQVNRIAKIMRTELTDLVFFISIQKFLKNLCSWLIATHRLF